MKTRISLGSLNWTGMIVAATLGFGASAFAAAKLAADTGEHDWKKLFSIGATAGCVAAFTAVSGVMTQRTDPDGKASAFPSLTSTDSLAAAALYPYDHDEPPVGVVGSIPLPVVATGDPETSALLSAAAALATKQQAAQARAAAIAAAEAEVARLKAAQ